MPMNLFRFFFKDRTVLGFYLPFAAAILALVSGFLYLGFSSSRYYSPLMSVFAIVGGASFLLLSLFPLTTRWASIPLFAFVFVAFLMLVKDGYLYFSEAFYGKFSLEALFKMDLCFLYPLLGSILAMVLSEFGIYAPSRKKGFQMEAKEAN